DGGHLLAVCSYPSSCLTSSPSDCIINVSCTTTPDCNDSNPCTIDTCDTTLHACRHVPGNNGATCNDNNACTQSDTCQDGQCVGSNPVVCQTPTDPCQNAGVCDPSTGLCSASTPKPEGAPCSDGNACTTGASSNGGSHTGATKVNNDNNNVYTTYSNNTTTACVHTNNTAPCNDGNACTLNDTCSNGACQPGAPKDCNDNNVCTDDSCNT